MTSVARGIRKLGLEIAARPFVYSETPDLDLDIFLNFTSATSYRVRYTLLTLTSLLPYHCAGTFGSSTNVSLSGNWIHLLAWYLTFSSCPHPKDSIRAMVLILIDYSTMSIDDSVRFSL